MLQSPVIVSIFFHTVLYSVLLLLLLSNVVVSKSIIKSLPGFKGDLPFLLETGYIGVGESDNIQLFYYFIESERSPEADPLVLWLTGGPGCSGFSGLVYEIGPLSFNYNTRSSKPTLSLNPYSWTKVANIIFIDSPVGTGFSYATNPEAYNNNSVTTTAAYVYEFLRKWLVDHPKFLVNPLYIAGDSFSGLVVPIVVQEIYNGNEAGRQPYMKLLGYVLGNPVTDLDNDLNSRIPFTHLKALISDDLYKSLKENCNGDYVSPNTSNAQCMEAIQYYDMCIEKIDPAQILEPSCNVSFSPRPASGILKWDNTILRDHSIHLLKLPTTQVPKPWCREYNYVWSATWANEKAVQEALHVRQGTIKIWVRCNWTLSFTYDILNTVQYHRNLTNTTYRALVYSGDHDLVIPYVGTLEWIESLNMTLALGWQPWFVDGQVAGYMMQYSHDKYVLTYATVKNGGHTAPEYKPEECLGMIDRWFSYYFI